MSMKLDQPLVLNGLEISTRMGEAVEISINWNEYASWVADRDDAIAIIQHLQQVFNLTSEELNNSEQ